MRKSFIALMAVAALVSCTNNETIATPEGAAIGFDAPFVENATRANDLTADNIENFGVYGYVEANGTGGYIFENQKVVKNGNAYTYSPAQYWIANAQYYFTSFAPQTTNWTYESKNAHTGVLTFNNQTAAANEDLLFAYEKPTTSSSIEARPAAVAFSYKHLLSRVKFTFTNGFADGQNIELSISNVTITNAYAEGKMKVTDGETAEQWIPTDGTNNLSIPFGEVKNADYHYLAALASGSTTHYYLIPANNASYDITFDVTLKQAGVPLDTYNREATVKLTMEPGCSYELKATLTANNTSDDGELYPIEFTVKEVEDWANFTEVETVPTVNVGTAEDLVEAIANGYNVVLTNDVTIASHLNITKSITIDLNGKTLNAAKDGAEVDAIWVRDNAEVVITGNGTINSSFDCVFATGSSKVTIENGTFVAAAEAVFAQANATVEILGGSFKSVDYPGFTLNLKDSARATASIVVKGGKFYNFDPSNNTAEGENTNFVADGFEVEQEGDWYSVVAE